MSNFTAIRTALDTELQALVTNDDLSCALFGRRWDFTGFPSVRYYLVGVDNELLAAGGGAGAIYRRAWKFQVDIVQEISQKDPQQGEIDLGTAVDAVLARLEDNWALGAAQDVILAPSANGVQEVESANGRLIIVPVTVVPRTILSYS